MHNEKHWTDRLSDIESQEKARCNYVGKNSALIFDSLYDNVQHAVTLYNKRHSDNFGAGSATVNKRADSGTFGCTAKKIVAPEAELVLTFPINSGTMEYQKQGVHIPKTSGVAEIEMTTLTEPITYLLDGSSLSEDEFVRIMLEDVLFTQDILTKASKVESA